MDAPSVPADPQPGQAIGPYRLQSRLGRGGMGEVWSAVYAGRRGFSKPVALKLLRTPHLDSETAVMFVDEARAAGELSHPAVVPTFDLGRHGPFSYIAMELVNGAALNVLLKRLSRDGVRLSPGAVAYVGERIASALDYGFRRAQAEGQPLRLVHRDVSPHNILVDDSGAIRLTDFGIARTAIQKHATAVGKFRGKAGYLSPEQVTGQPLDDRSDVFSLCIVLWECATGRRLFRRKTLADSIAATREEPAPRLTTMVPGFPFALSDVIAQGLAKCPEDRMDTAEFAEALRQARVDVATGQRELALLIRTIEPAEETRPEARARAETPKSTAAEITDPEASPATKADPTRNMSEFVSVITEAFGSTTSWMKPGLLVASLVAAALGGYGARDVVEVVTGPPAVEVAFAEPSDSARATVRPQVSAALVEDTESPVRPAPKKSRSARRRDRPRTASAPSSKPAPTSGARATRMPIETQAVAESEFDSPWDALARLARTQPSKAAQLRADLTEAYASNRIDKVRAVSARIAAADRQ